MCTFSPRDRVREIRRSGILLSSFSMTRARIVDENGLLILGFPFPGEIKSPFYETKSVPPSLLFRSFSFFFRGKLTY